MHKLKSNVWTHAKRIDESLVKCSLCNETVTANSMYNFNGYPGTRSNLIRVPGWHFTTYLTPLLLTNKTTEQITDKQTE